MPEPEEVSSPLEDTLGETLIREWMELTYHPNNWLDAVAEAKRRLNWQEWLNHKRGS